MSDRLNQDLDSLMAALRRFVEDLPDDLGHLPLRKLSQAAADPEQRARMEPAAARFDETVAPIMQRWREAAQSWDRSIRSALEPCAEAGRWLTQLGEQLRSASERSDRAWRELMQPFELALQRMHALGERLQEMAQLVPQAAAEYCGPYQRQIAQLQDHNIGLLTPADEMQFMITGIIVTPPQERSLGYRPPLEGVAVMCRRFGLATAILSIDRPQLVKWTRRLASFQELDDLPGEVFVTLCETVLPSIERRVGDLTYPQAAEKLKGWMSDWYLAAAVKNNIRRTLKQQRTRRGREIRFEEAGMAPGEEDLVETGTAIDRVVVRDALEEYLRQSKRPELDRAIVDALGERRSMRSLAAERGMSDRTLQQRGKNLVDFLARRLVVPRQS